MALRKRQYLEALRDTRAAFRKRMEESGSGEVWTAFRGRIAVMLPGGGARGAYQAGVLLAFQDAQLPTHILAGTSIGAVNAAVFAANAKGFVGGAEGLIRFWCRLTPLAVGVEWTRYLWVTVGFVAATAGLGNLLRAWLELQGFSWHVQRPLLAWSLLAVSGAAIVFFYDRLPYLGFLLRRAGPVDRRKARDTLVANGIVWGCVIALLAVLDVHGVFQRLLAVEPWVSILMLVGFGLLIFMGRVVVPRTGVTLGRLFSLPLRRGLFSNFARTRLLRRGVSQEALRETPIRILFQAADLEFGPIAVFANHPPETLANDPGADRDFAHQEVVCPEDLILALTASSALPLVYEPVRFRGRLLADGALVGSQPVRPAVRMGADVMFLVAMDPLTGPWRTTRSLLDTGLRALNILSVRNFITDLRLLENFNKICARQAERLGLRPEEVSVDLGTRTYRYVAYYLVKPPATLDVSMLDFGGRRAARLILQGYTDTCEQIARFLSEAPAMKVGGARRVLRLAADWSRS